MDYSGKATYQYEVSMERSGIVYCFIVGRAGSVFHLAGGHHFSGSSFRMMRYKRLCIMRQRELEYGQRDGYWG
jgi:hypothetical protein